MSKEKEIKKSEIATSNKSNYIEKLKENIESIIVPKSNCKLCNSPNRLEAEKLYDQNKTFKTIHKWLEDQGESYDYKSVCNHFNEHYTRQRINLMVSEYIEGFVQYRIDQVTDLDRLETRRDMLEKAFLVLAAQNDTTTNVSEIRKNSTALKALNDSVASVESQINEIKKENEPVVIVLKTLEVLISEAIQETSSEEVQKALISLLNNFEERVDGLFAE